ncbi:Dihydropteroate synthase [Rasamsonia emersonii CBS 393.64]|uniref:Folic acid synthesis protein FOL1 n=1 Tax=Rasamsonia emersonii (strain ATCC 16479 / CBS 393.64 / IMI 116815) TaxID=1408163 RepID=A0A0F4YML8_RASE3|nr:Dihydropteroate synthase [Rasamsonia emersonii CBS 393.64]KKA19096.1 Dihydropteroate synthase [Rasamsonia emersonii CBS 393.64]
MTTRTARCWQGSAGTFHPLSFCGGQRVYADISIRSRLFCPSVSQERKFSGTQRKRQGPAALILFNHVLFPARESSSARKSPPTVRWFSSSRNSLNSNQQDQEMRAQKGNGSHRAFIALGSNMGDRIGMIERACLEMERAGIKIKRTSSLFETAPMYVLDQEPFINGACEIETTMDPIQLLDTLQSIEKGLGRQKTIDKGPRVIDLDILLYDNEIVSHPRLNIPHKLMLEREFVLRPLCQLIPHERSPLPGMNLTFLSQLKSLPPPETPPVVTTPIAPFLPPLTPSDPKRRTHVMAILNVTPDSFSDGGQHYYSPDDFSRLTATVRNFISAGATIIDIGGESTRPNSVPVTEEEELARVIPVIRHIRTSIPEAANVAISIDTYHARVAAEACAAGADIINDVSAGTLDPDMLPTMARTGKTVILMHMRGTPSTMTRLTDYPNGVIQDVGSELLARVRAAEEAGVRRWRIILDPGLGFAKGQTQNLTLLRDMPRLRNEIEGLEYFPWLVGTSRKGYIGRITGVEKASERTWGTAAAVTASVASGADIVRVHDVAEMSQVVKMADAIYRV